MSTEYIIEPTFGEAFARPKRKRTLRTILLVCLLVVVGGAALLYWLEKPPADFPVQKSVVIEPGSSVRQIATELEEQNVVRSRWLLYAIILLSHNPSDLKASTYIFDSPIGTTAIAERLTKGDFSNDLVAFTHIEGESVEDTAARASVVLTDFDSTTFIALGTPFEGKLFPDTYHIPKNFTAKELLELMQKTFEEKILSQRADITASGLTEQEVITFASILEREANSPESMKMVAGILHNRLEEGMYLQVDASLEYTLHKTLQELTASDLEIDSPYNTYTNPGLPPTPIGNPGLDAITAVLHPTPSDYFFYITDTEGNFHYAKTFDEHKVNVARYLR